MVITVLNENSAAKYVLIRTHVDTFVTNTLNVLKYINVML